MTPSEANNNAYIVGSLGELFERASGFEPLGPFEERRVHEIRDALGELLALEAPAVESASPIENIGIQAVANVVPLAENKILETAQPVDTPLKSGELTVEAARRAAQAAYDDAGATSMSFDANNDQFAIAG